MILYSYFYICNLSFKNNFQLMYLGFNEKAAKNILKMKDNRFLSF